jgi:hypothetical protein
MLIPILIILRAKTKLAQFIINKSEKFLSYVLILIMFILTKKYWDSLFVIMLSKLKALLKYKVVGPDNKKN